MLTTVFGVSCRVSAFAAVYSQTAGSLGVLGTSKHHITSVIIVVRQRIGCHDMVICLRQCFKSHLLFSNSCVCVCVFFWGVSVGPDFLIN